jgi:hypothetical protein
MRSKNQLPGGPALRMFANDGDDETISPLRPGANLGTTRAGQSKASGRRLRSHLEVVDRAGAGDRVAARDAAFQIKSGSDASWRSMLASRLLAAIKSIVGFAASSAAALSDALLAVMSWTIAQILAGCAEYCQAMYPTFVELDEPADSHDATSAPESDQRVADQLSRRQPSLCRAIAPLLHRERETRRAMMAPRAFDAPVLRNTETSRHRTEDFAGIGDHCE